MLGNSPVKPWHSPRHHSGSSRPITLIMSSFSNDSSSSFCALYGYKAITFSTLKRENIIIKQYLFINQNCILPKIASFIWILPPETGVLRPLSRPLCSTFTYVAGNQPICLRRPRPCSSPSHQPESVFLRIIMSCPRVSDSCSVLVASYGAMTCATSPFCFRRPCK